MVDSITEEILNASLAGVVKQMQEALFRTGFSTIIRESHDASCAVLTAGGDVAAQHIVLPLHLGVFPVSIKALIETGKTPKCSGKTICCAATSPPAVRTAQLASWLSRMIVENPVRNSASCICFTTPAREAFRISSVIESTNRFSFPTL